MSARDELAAAVSALDGLNCSPYYRQSLKPGDASVRLGARNRDDSGLGFIDTWEVLIAISQDIATAEKWLETRLDAVIEALSEVFVVTSATPTELVIGTGSVPGIVIEGALAA